MTDEALVWMEAAPAESNGVWGVLGWWGMVVVVEMGLLSVAGLGLKGRAKGKEEEEEEEDTVSAAP